MRGEAMRDEDTPMQVVGKGRKKGGISRGSFDGGGRMAADMEVQIKGVRRSGQAHWTSRILRRRQDTKSLLFALHRLY